MKRVFFLILALVVLVGCGPSPREREYMLALERERTDQIEAQAEVSAITAEYEGRSILTITKAHADIAEGDARALRDMATFWMRRAEAWRMFIQIVVVLLLLAALFVVLQVWKREDTRYYEAKRWGDKP